MARQVSDTHGTTSPRTTSDLPNRAPNRGARWLWLPAIIVGSMLVAAAAAVRTSEPPLGHPSTDIAAEDGGLTVRQGAPQWNFLKLATVSAVGGHWTDTVQARVAIDERSASKIGAPVPGRVTRVMVELGDTVGEGQPLFALASPDIATLRTEREHAMVELDAARTAAARIEAIVDSRALPVKDLVSATQRVREAELALQLADQKLASMRVSPGTDHELVVAAPHGGVVVEKKVLVNQQVTADAGGDLLVVANLSSVWAIADVFEGQTLDIRPGDAAELTTPSVPGSVIPGRVLMVSSIGDPERHTLPVRVQIANTDGRLRPNVYARVRFSVRQPSATVEVPASALLSDGDHQYVYVQRAPGHFVRRDVVAGSAHEGRLPIVSGLAEGEVVVEQGAILLDNQMAILNQ